MKKVILFFFIILIVSCKHDKYENNIKNKKEIEKVVDTTSINDGFNAIKTLTYYLKNDYKLIIFPALERGKKVINFRLINGKKDNTYFLSDRFESPFIEVYQNKDFQNYFTLHSNLGTHNPYFWLYEKETGKEVFTGVGRDFDLKNELILYEDEDKDYNLFVYDVNTKVKTLIEIPSELMEKQECTKYNDSYKTIFIKRVSKEYYYLGFKSCEPSSVEFKVKKAKQ